MNPDPRTEFPAEVERLNELRSQTSYLNRFTTRERVR